MHSIIKSTFYIVFIALSLLAGVSMLLKSKGDKRIKVFGLMVLILGLGESFHLVPRIHQIFSSSTDIEPMIETGRFIASMTIILAYMMMLWFKDLYDDTQNIQKNKVVLYLLAVLGLILSVVFRDTSNLLLILVRNLPTMVLGGMLVYFFKQTTSDTFNTQFKYLWLVILLALVFTVGFELLSQNYPFFIILMMPKTLMYIWLVLMGYIGFLKKKF